MKKNDKPATARMSMIGMAGTDNELEDGGPAASKVCKARKSLNKSARTASSKEDAAAGEDRSAGDDAVDCGLVSMGEGADGRQKRGNNTSPTCPRRPT